MTIKRVQSRAIQAGYDWTVRLSLANTMADLPVGASFTAQIRATPTSAQVLGTLLSGDGNITRIDAHTLDVKIPGSISSDWTVESVVFDIVQTVSAVKTHLGFSLTVPVRPPVTRGI